MSMPKSLPKTQRTRPAAAVPAAMKVRVLSAIVKATEEQSDVGMHDALWSPENSVNWPFHESFAKIHLK
jgi:hypothetical protein